MKKIESKIAASKNTEEAIDIIVKELALDDIAKEQLIESESIYIIYLEKGNYQYKYKSGNEVGANSFFIPGKYNATGYKEAVLAGDPIVHNKNLNQFVKNRNTFKVR